jgi:menaquinone-dependent protoporphyrinogen oxidase
MDGRVLVAYATKYGATQEIAAAIGGALSSAGLAVDVLQVDRVKDVSSYRAVILGSAVYVGQWRKEAVAFLVKHEVALSERPVWLFSSGPSGKGDPGQLMSGWKFPEAQKPIAERIHARETALFHGALDPDKLSLLEKLILKGVKAPLGDFRDFESVRAWGSTIAAALKHPGG